VCGGGGGVMWMWYDVLARSTIRCFVRKKSPIFGGETPPDMHLRAKQGWKEDERSKERTVASAYGKHVDGNIVPQ
jgi:hypothetical protein